MNHLPIICVDLDGVLASWEGGTFEKIGPPIPGAKEFVSDLTKIGEVVVYTCRTTSRLYDDQPVADLIDVVWEWLLDNGFNVHAVYAGQGKPNAACYIDDRGIHCRPEQDVLAFRNATELAARMCASAIRHSEKQK